MTNLELERELEREICKDAMSEINDILSDYERRAEDPHGIIREIDAIVTETVYGDANGSKA
jgi:hypothetical protein